MKKSEVFDYLFNEYIWWSPKPEKSFPCYRLLATLMRYATYDDLKLAQGIWDEKDFQVVLKSPPVGVFDNKNWSYWHQKLGVSPIPPLPEKSYGA